MSEVDVSPAIAAIHTWLEGWESRIPPSQPRVGLAWRRDGLVALYGRLEQLKIYDQELSALLVEAIGHLARCRAWTSICAQQIEDILGPTIEGKAAGLVQRGLASDERWLAHRTRAAVPWSQQRALERQRDLLEGAVEALRTLVFSERDERNDIRAQLRAINVGIEIGEL